MSVLVLATSRLVVGAVATLVARRRVGRLLLVGAVVEAFRTGTYLYATLRGASDQSRNPIAAIRRNADTEGLTDRIDLVTGDMRALPFDDATFDLVASSLSLHNIPDTDDRSNAVSEAVRACRAPAAGCCWPMRCTPMPTRPRREGAAPRRWRRPLGWQVWYAEPGFGLSMVTARKP